MECFDKDYKILLKIRSIRAEKAEREMVEADARRHASLATLDHANALAVASQENVRIASSKRRQFANRQVNGADLQALRSGEIIAKARLEDCTVVVSQAKVEVDRTTSEAEAARSVFAKAHRLVIKTETIIDELKTGELD